MIQLAIDPPFDDPLDVAEVHHHVAVVEAVGADVDLDGRVVSVRMLADAVVIEEPVAVTELDPLRDEVHVREIYSAVLFSGGLDSAVLLADADGRVAATDAAVP